MVQPTAFGRTCLGLCRPSVFCLVIAFCPHDRRRFHSCTKYFLRLYVLYIIYTNTRLLLYRYYIHIIKSYIRVNIVSLYNRHNLYIFTYIKHSTIDCERRSSSQFCVHSPTLPRIQVYLYHLRLIQSIL